MVCFDLIWWWYHEDASPLDPCTMRFLAMGWGWRGVCKMLGGHMNASSIHVQQSEHSCLFIECIWRSFRTRTIEEATGTEKTYWLAVSDFKHYYNSTLECFSRSIQRKQFLRSPLFHITSNTWSWQPYSNVTITITIFRSPRIAFDCERFVEVTLPPQEALRSANRTGIRTSHTYQHRLFILDSIQLGNAEDAPSPGKPTTICQIQYMFRVITL